MKIIIEQKPKPPRRISLRDLAMAITLARWGHILMTHAQRDRCATHYVEAMSCLALASRTLPKRYHDSTWWHRHVVAPGDRAYMRMVAEGELR